MLCFSRSIILHIGARQPKRLRKSTLDVSHKPTYSISVIRSFRSKALKRFAATGNGSKLPVQNHDRLRRLLDRLEASVVPEDMNLPGYRFHGLQGDPKRYAADASASYRLAFAWDGVDAIDVDLEDYH